MAVILPNLRFTHATSFTSAANHFLSDRSLIWDYLVTLWMKAKQLPHDVLNWLEKPDVYILIITFAITFTILLWLGLSLGFGPFGVVAGSLAAAFQSWMYGGFTPAAGMFATFTSIAMLGWMIPAVTIFALVGAVITTVVVGVVRSR